MINVKFNEHYVPSIYINDMYKQLNLLKLNDIYKYFCIKFLHTILYGTRTHLFNIHFLQLLPQHHYNTRGIKLNIPPIRLEIERTLPIYNCVTLINSIPDFLIQPQSSLTLKKNAKKYFLDKY